MTNLVDEDFLFVNVETQPPRLTNFTNVMNGAENFVSSFIYAFRIIDNNFDLDSEIKY